jgi:hypothetical protein
MARKEEAGMGRFLATASAALMVCIAGGGFGATWYVDGSVASPGDGKTRGTAFKTIQEGIDAASAGDTVIVGEGTYAENIEFNGKNIAVRSADPCDWAVVEKTTVDGGKRGSTVTFAGTENQSCLLSGFTIQNGNAQTGGGIAGHGTGATIQSNWITGNSADGVYPAGGGGLADCDGMIQGNRITGNSAFSGGGGLYSCGGTIRNNTITANEASWGAGLIWCGGPIHNNIIALNAAAYGGGLHSCDGPISDNVVAGNSATARGGGLFDCAGLVEGNVVTHNTGVDGGGLVGCEGRVQGNTIADNSADEEGGGLWECAGTIANCIIWGNTASDGEQLYDSNAPTYCCIQDWAGGEGNIDLDPQFFDSDGPDDNPATYEDNDYRLSAGSPCIDAGDNSALDKPPGFDLDGNLRVAFGEHSFTVDMGAYEYNSVPFTIIEIARTGSSQVRIVWNSQPSDTYTVWSRDDVSVGPWLSRTTLPSQGATTEWTDMEALPQMRCYRVEMAPE